MMIVMTTVQKKSVLFPSLVIKGHQRKVNGIEIFEDSVWTVSDDHFVCVWNLKVGVSVISTVDLLSLTNRTEPLIQSGELVSTKTSHSRPVKSITRFGSFIITGSLDRTILFWDAKSRTLVSKLEIESEILHVNQVSEMICIGSSYNVTFASQHDLNDGGKSRTEILRAN